MTYKGDHHTLGSINPNPTNPNFTSKSITQTITILNIVNYEREEKEIKETKKEKVETIIPG